MRSRLQVSNHVIWGGVICGHSCPAGIQIDGKSGGKLTDISLVSLYFLSYSQDKTGHPSDLHPPAFLCQKV